jgi:hypothetical protein
VSGLLRSFAAIQFRVLRAVAVQKRSVARCGGQDTRAASERHDFEHVENAEIIGVVREQPAHAAHMKQSGVLSVENAFSSKLQVIHPLEPALDGFIV